MKLPNKKYKTILADPPWKYGKGFGFGAGEYYPLMTIGEIIGLNIGNKIADENCHLYLWCISFQDPTHKHFFTYYSFDYFVINFLLFWVLLITYILLEDKRKDMLINKLETSEMIPNGK